MSMDLWIKLMRVQNLEADIKSLKKDYKEKVSRLEGLQEKCNHELVIVANANIGYSVEANCLFCGKRFSSPHDLRELPKKSLL